MTQDTALPLHTIYEPSGKPYVSIIDEGETIKIQLHRYDSEFRNRIFLTLDKKALPDLIKALEKYEPW